MTPPDELWMARNPFRRWTPRRDSIVFDETCSNSFDIRFIPGAGPRAGRAGVGFARNQRIP